MDTPAPMSPLPGSLDLTPEEEEDTRAIIEKLMTGKPLPPELERRIRERGERISREVYEKHGLQDLAVPLIRALRDGDDEDD